MMSADRVVVSVCFQHVSHCSLSAQSQLVYSISISGADEH